MTEENVIQIKSRINTNVDASVKNMIYVESSDETSDDTEIEKEYILPP